MVKRGKLSPMEMLSVLPSHMETTRQIQAEAPSVKLLVWTLQKGWRAVPDKTEALITRLHIPGWSPGQDQQT